MLTVSALALAACFAQTPTAQPTPSTTAQPAGSPELVRILDAYVEFLLREDPEMASRTGDNRFAADLPDLSPEGVARRDQAVRDLLGKLAALDRTAWTEDDHVDAEIARFELDRRAALAPFHPEQMPITNRDGIQITLLQTLDSIKTDTPDEKAAWASRLEKIPTLVDQAIAQMRAGLAAKRVQPRVVMLGAAEQCFALVTDSARGNRFFTPFAQLPANDPLALRATKAVESGVNPAFAKLGAFLRDEYIPHCRETIGESSSVDGAASYAIKARGFTTIDLSPDDIHAIGLREVVRIRTEMMAAIDRAGFGKDLPPDDRFRAFVKDLRENPKFYHKTEAELLHGYRELAKRVDAELPRLFRVLPRNTYGVRELPKYMQSTAPNGYYYPGTLAAGVPGFFMVNTYRLDQRPTYEMTALFLHEAVPGHHLQIALQSEIETGHRIRRIADYTVFVEGWALYAEQLGLEMTSSEGASPDRGLYADPYQDFGRLSYEMWRACRLVVDTGIHAKGWTRAQAIQYMLDNTALSPLNIEKEVDRYISWPGQALGYMIGLLEIRALRKAAETALGDRFDLREFHDVLLGAGGLPVSALEDRIRRWVGHVKARGPAAK